MAVETIYTVHFATGETIEYTDPYYAGQWSARSFRVTAETRGANA